MKTGSTPTARWLLFFTALLIATACLVERSVAALLVITAALCALAILVEIAEARND